MQAPCPQTLINRLRKAGKAIPKALLDSHRLYQRDSVSRCRKVRRLGQSPLLPSGRLMTYQGITGFSFFYDCSLGYGVPT